MPVTVTYKGGMEFEVNCRDHCLTVDLPEPSGGRNAGPTAPELFIASLGACIGIYVADYCNRAGLATDGLHVEMDWDVVDKPKRIGALRAKVYLPEPVSPDREKAIRRVADQCLLKNTLLDAPQMALELSTPTPTEAAPTTTA
jgi:uncharacterized OsmC-like protein